MTGSAFGIGTSQYQPFNPWSVSPYYSFGPSVTPPGGQQSYGQPFTHTALSPIGVGTSYGPQPLQILQLLQIVPQQLQQLQQLAYLQQQQLHQVQQLLQSIPGQLWQLQHLIQFVPHQIQQLQQQTQPFSQVGGPGIFGSQPGQVM